MLGLPCLGVTRVAAIRTCCLTPSRHASHIHPHRLCRDREAAIRCLALDLTAALLSPGRGATQALVTSNWPDCVHRLLRVAGDVCEAHSVRAAALRGLAACCCRSAEGGLLRCCLRVQHVVVVERGCERALCVGREVCLGLRLLLLRQRWQLGAQGGEAVQEGLAVRGAWTARAEHVERRAHYHLG